MEYTDLPDEILLKLLKADDQQAFQQLFERHWQHLYESTLKKVQCIDTAKDVVQNIFSNIWEQRYRANIQHLKPYLQTAAKNKVINHYRKKMLTERYLKETETIAPSGENNTEVLQSFNELYSQFQESLKQLPSKTREIFTLSRIENLPVKQIAAEMNLSEKAVEYHITSSLKRLRVSLKDFLPLLAIWTI